MGKTVLKGYDFKAGDIIDRIAEEEKDRKSQVKKIKEKIDIVSLFSSFGVVLKKKGSSYLGLCPFHEDKNPSLSVDRGKGLYNCFGCGESGDVFSLVEKMKGVGFADALEYLKNYSGEARAALSTKKPGKKKESAAPSPPEPPQKTPTSTISLQQESLPEITLRTVAEYYHKKLYSNREAKGYLKKRGLNLRELLGRFGVGFADGSLTSKISNGQKGALKDLGILRDSGKEHLYNCITIPLHDNTGNITGLYGRSIKDNGKLKHLYLKGPHRGIFNYKASKVYDEIILTESILDSLSLLSLEIQNVQALYGINGLTDEHLDLLKADRVKTVILALDSDDAGKKASEVLKEQLLEEGFAVKVILPPKTKDWNEELLKGLKKDSLTHLISSSQIFYPNKEKTFFFEVEKEGIKYIFKFLKLSYCLTGVKDTFISSLKVNIRAFNNDNKYIDNVELYSARSRRMFAANLSLIFNLDAAVFEKQLIKIIEYLEGIRDKNLRFQSDKKYELSDEERALGLKFLKDSNLFAHIVHDMEVLGYVGEDVNKKLLYLAASSRKMADPVSVIIISQSAAGKSYLIDTVKKLIPLEDVVSVTSLSDQALNYLPEEGLMHKLLLMGEAVHSEVVEHQIREMLSSHELSRLVTMKDTKTGVMKSEVVKKDVIVSLLMSSTDYRINTENLSRCFVINTDESEEQTKNIHRIQREKYTLESYRKKNKYIPLIIKTHHAAQRLLKKRVIVNPFAHLLDFPAKLIRSRRDHERFIDLIAVITFLRQFQKEEKEQAQSNGEKIYYIESDLTDYDTAYSIMKQILPATLINFPESAQRLYEIFRRVIKDRALNTNLKVMEVKLTQRELRELTGLSHDSIKRNLRILVEYEYIKAFGKVRGSKKTYSLVKDEKLIFINLSGIATPLQIEERLKSGVSGVVN